MSPQESYRELQQQVCPRCGSPEASAGSGFEIEAGTVSQEVTCARCGHHRTEVYRFAYVLDMSTLPKLPKKEEHQP